MVRKNHFRFKKNVLNIIFHSQDDEKRLSVNDDDKFLINILNLLPECEWINILRL